MGLLNHIHHAEFSELCTRVNDSSVDMVLCDLPYGIVSCNWDTVIPFDIVWEHFKRIIKPNGAIVLTATEPFASHLRLSWLEGYRYDWTWDKVRVTGHLDADKRPLRRHESILVFSHKSSKYYPQKWQSGIKKSSKGGHSRVYGKNGERHYKSDGERYPTSILQYSMPDAEKGLHPTQKPVALFKYLIKTYTQSNEIVFDPTCGSGTTAIACRQLGRNFICGDNNNEYVDIARKRLAKQDISYPLSNQSGEIIQRSLFK